MKLLADQPAVDVEEPPHRPARAVLGGIAVLVVMLGVGLALLLSSGGSDDHDAEPAAGLSQTDQAVAPDEPTVDMTAWTAAVNDACAAVESRFGTVVDNGETPLIEVDDAVRSLTSAVSTIAMPTERTERSDVMTVVLAGDEAEQAWYGISGLDRDDVPAAEIERADRLTHVFLDRLVALGTDCHTLR